MKSREMTILVTGAGGYLGHHLVARLAGSGCHVIALDTYPRGTRTLEPLIGTRGAVVRCNVLDLEQIKSVFAAYSPNVCIHLAALVGDGLCEKHPNLALSINRDAVGTTCRMAAESGCSAFLLASTCSVYGVQTLLKASETDIPAPISLYGRSKCDAEKLVLGLQTPSFRVVVARLSTLFGVSKRMRFDLTVNQFAAEAHRYGQIEVFAENSVRPYIHACDAARALEMLALDSAIPQGIYNVGDDGNNLTKKEIIDHVRSVWPATKIVKGTSTTDRRDYSVLFSKVAACGWRPSFTVMDGIREVHEWLLWRDNDIDIYGADWRASCP